MKTFLTNLRPTGWRVLRGPHHSAADLGGGCVNELALVVSGRAWRRIGSPRMLPSDFSEVFSTFAMHINDRIASDAMRTRLMGPFITRLAWTADYPDVEWRRALLLADRAGVRYNPQRTVERRAFSWGGTFPDGDGPFQVQSSTIRAINHTPTSLAEQAAITFISTGGYEAACSALDEAMKIGKQPDPLDNYVASERVTEECAKTRSAGNWVSVATGSTGMESFFAKLLSEGTAAHYLQVSDAPAWIGVDLSEPTKFSLNGVAVTEDCQ